MAIQSVPADLTPVRAEKPGALPPENPRDFFEIVLPPGRHLATYTAEGTKVWVADVSEIPDLKDAIASLQRIFPETGLWPLLMSDRFSDADGMIGWPHDEAPPTATGEEVLYERWQKFLTESEEPLLNQWPGVGRPATPGTDTEVTPLAGSDPSLIGAPIPHLALVPTTRPADIPLVLGPEPFNSHPSPQEATAVFRSWEDRYGALLTEYSEDAFSAGLRRVPHTRDEAHQLLVEATAFSIAYSEGCDLSDMIASTPGPLYIGGWWD